MDTIFSDQFRSVVIGALFHDIGKFFQRADSKINYKSSNFLDENTKKNIDLVCPSYKGRYSHKHALWTFQYLKEREGYFKQLFSNAVSLEQNNFINLASFHHNPSTALQYLIQFADRISSGMERASEQDDLAEDESSKFNFRTVRLKPIFELISLSGPKKSASNYRHNIAPFDMERASLFPQEASKIRPPLGEDLGSEYNKIWDAFDSDLTRISPANFYYAVMSLLALLEKYAWCVPSSTSERPDISLYDHLKTTAAVASCIYKYHEKDGAKESILNREDEKFILLGGDLSGIQNYIFNLAQVNVKKVSKTLRARSFYLTMLPKVIVTKILFENGLTSANSLMETGGRFVLLLPNTNEVHDYLTEFSRNLGNWCLNEFYGELMVNLDWSVSLTANDFFKKNFSEKYALLSERLEENKLKKMNFKRDQTWSESNLVIASDYEAMQKENANLCGVCGKKPAESQILDEDKEPVYICDSCLRHQAIGEKLASHNFIVISIDKGDTAPHKESYIFDFDDKKYSMTLEAKWSSYKDLIRLDNFVAGFQIGAQGENPQFVPNELLANHVPRFSRQDVVAYKRYYQTQNSQIQDLTYIAESKIKTFSDLAISKEALANPQEPHGAQFLAIFKADVDNLGLIFGKGLQEDMSISRYSTLSRMINAFFAGYLNTFIEEKYPDIYTVYAGGDDVFLIGNWQNIINFGPDFNDQFIDYTCRNEDIHLSAGIELIKPQSPIYRGARQAEESLEMAKSILSSQSIPVKNSLSIFNTVVRWNEWDWIHEWMVFLDRKLSLSRGQSEEGEMTKINSAFLYRLLRYQKMAQSYWQDGNIEGLLYLSFLSYDIARNITLPHDKNSDIENELEKLSELQDITSDRIKKIHIPVFYALYKNRGG